MQKLLALVVEFLILVIRREANKGDRTRYVKLKGLRIVK